MMSSEQIDYSRGLIEGYNLLLTYGGLADREDLSYMEISNILVTRRGWQPEMVSLAAAAYQLLVYPATHSVDRIDTILDIQRSLKGFLNES